MLAELEIENLAVIAHARIPFSPHLNVFLTSFPLSKTASASGSVNQKRYCR